MGEIRDGREVGAEEEEGGGGGRAGDGADRASELGFGELGDWVGVRLARISIGRGGAARWAAATRREPAAAGSPHGFRGLGWAGLGWCHVN